MTAETGVLCALFALVDLYLFATYKGTNYHLALCIELSKIYSNSILLVGVSDCVERRFRYSSWTGTRSSTRGHIWGTDVLVQTTTASTSTVSSSELESKQVSRISNSARIFLLKTTLWSGKNNHVVICGPKSLLAFGKLDRTQLRKSTSTNVLYNMI
jgi:hypothetical protein